MTTPSIPPLAAAANSAIPVTGSTPGPKPSKTSKPNIPIVGDKPNLETLPKSGTVINDWNMFTDGSFSVIAVGPGGTSIEPYISGVQPTKANPNPSPIVILPSADGQGFQIESVDSVAERSLLNISAFNTQSYKMKLRAYYPSEKAFRLSISTTDKDVAFVAAVKRALSNASVDNFDSGKINAAAKAANPNAALPMPLYNFDSYVASRPDVPSPQSFSESTSGLTKREDAIAEFYRTTQQYVGDPTLVDKLPVLAEAYWDKLHKTELNRRSVSSSTTDILGNTVRSGVQYAQLSDQDRLEMRVNFLTKGVTVTGKDGKKITSQGIKNADAQSLQDAGGLIGNSYTKLIEHAYAMGIPVNNADLAIRAGKTLIPGGSVDAEIRSMTEAAKIHYRGLSTSIASGLKVSDIANIYQSQRDNELELTSGTTDIFNDNVQKAIRGDSLQDANDFLLEVRKDPTWRYTKKANEAAAGFIDTILKTWGKVG